MAVVTVGPWLTCVGPFPSDGGYPGRDRSCLLLDPKVNETPQIPPTETHDSVIYVGVNQSKPTLWCLLHPFPDLVTGRSGVRPSTETFSQPDFGFGRRHGTTRPVSWGRIENDGTASGSGTSPTCTVEPPVSHRHLVLVLSLSPVPERVEVRWTSPVDHEVRGSSRGSGLYSQELRKVPSYLGTDTGWVGTRTRVTPVTPWKWNLFSSLETSNSTWSRRVGVSCKVLVELPRVGPDLGRTRRLYSPSATHDVPLLP